MNNAQVRKFNTKEVTTKVLHKDDTLILTSMDVFTAKDSVFFTVENLSQIRHLNFKTNKETIVSGVGKPGPIAVDWISENVYFVDEAEKTIMVCHMDKKKCAKIQNFDKDSKVKKLDLINS